MTRRRFYAAPEQFSPDGMFVTLSADETRHLHDVLRLKPGDEVVVFDGRGHEFRGDVENIARGSTTIRIVERVAGNSFESPLNLTIAMALLKGEKFDLVAQKLAELGVAGLIPIITARADVRLRNESDVARRLDRWRRIVMEATKQCGRTCLMKIAEPIAFKRLIEQPPAEGEQRLMFSERDGTSLQDAIDQIPQAPEVVTAVIGSEGGWADEEIDQARAAGWKVVTLRERIMRAETAAIVIAALLQHQFGDLR